MKNKGGTTVKKLAAFVLALCLLLPALSLSEEYSPALGLTVSSFMLKYNAVGSSLNSSLLSLRRPFQWTKFSDYNVAWLEADRNSGVTILLLSSDPLNAGSIVAGVDQIQVFTDRDSDFMSLITVASRCVQLFSDDLFGANLAPLYVADVISYYWENANDTEYFAYRSIDAAQNYIIRFFKSSGQYYFTINPRGEE